MAPATKCGRDEVVALINGAMRATAIGLPPESGDGWVTISATPDNCGNCAFPTLWVPKPLAFWAAVLRGGWEEKSDQLDLPDLSLKAWPDLETALRRYLICRDAP
jgi:hypothetical protein